MAEEKKSENKAEKTRNLTKAVGSLYFKVSLVALCLGLMGWAIFSGWRHLTSLKEFCIQEVHFKVYPEEGVKEELQREVKDNKKILGRSLFEKRLTDRVAEAFRRNPWVFRVRSVERIFPDKLQVELELRRPQAVLKKSDSYYLLDQEGVVLPGRYYSWPKDQGKTPYIQSTKLNSIPEPGRRIEDKGVKAGIELVRFLKQNNTHRLLGLKAVDVSNVGKGRPRGESDIVLWTDTGVAIKWGCPPLCQQVDELPEGEKLKNLMSVVKAEGQRLAQMEYVDVRWSTPRGKRR